MDKMSLNAAAPAEGKFSPLRRGFSGPTPTEFEKIFSAGKSINTPYFRLIFAPGTQKVGIATSKSIGCHAKRNRIKRKVKVIVQNHQDLVDANTDWVIVVKMAAAQAGFKQLEEELCQSLTNAQLRLNGGQPASASGSF